MRILSLSSALIIICVLIASCGGKKDEWTTYTSGDGGFSVLMPGKDINKKDKVEVTPFGKQTVHFVSWKPSNFSISKLKLFEVSYTDCPQRFITDSIMMDVMLDSSINMRKKDFTEKDINSEAVSFNGYPGRAFIFDMQGNNTIAIVKQFICNGRRYDLTVVAIRDQGSNDESTNFFNSFQVIR